MGRAPCCDKDGLKKGPWTPEEDKKLVGYIQKHGYGNWRTLPKNAGLQRCGKSCRLRWTNYLRPDIKRGRFSIEEDEAIIHLHSILGNKWSAIAACLPGRTDNEIKNHWNTHIRKRLLRMGIDPVTHAPRLDLLDLSSILDSPPYNTTSLHHMFSDISSLQSRVDPSINPELLKLAAHLGLSQSENRDHAIQESQVVPNCQFNDLYHSTTVQENRFGNGPVPFPIPDEPRLVQPGVSDLQLQPDSSDFIPDSSYSSCIYGQEKLALDPSSQNGYRNLSHGASVYSTPSSSPTPLNSNSTYINSAGTEDEMEIISYCSNYYDLMSYEIPEIMDVSELVELSQTV